MLLEITLPTELASVIILGVAWWLTWISKAVIRIDRRLLSLETQLGIKSKEEI